MTPTTPTPPAAPARQRLGAAVALVASMLFFAGSFTLTKIALVDVPPMTLALLRFALASVLLAAWFTATRTWERPTRAHLRRLALGGLLGVTFYFALENLGVSWSTATDANLLAATFPAIMAIMDVGLQGARYRLGAWLGIGLAVAGAVGIVLGAPAATAGETPLRLWGNLLLVSGAVVWGFYTFVTREVIVHYSPWTTVFWQDAVGTVAFVPLVLLEVPRWRPPTQPLATAASVVGLAVFCSILAMALYAAALRHLPVSTVAASINLMPLFGLVIAVLVLRETVAPLQLGAGALVMLGVWLTQRSNRVSL